VRWLADECVDAHLVTRLREAGHDVVYLAEVDPSAPDADIAVLAQKEGRLLLTEDKDFGNLIVRWRAEVPGLVLLRIEPQRRHLKWMRLEAAIARYGELLLGRHTVVEEARFRCRALRSS